MCLHTIGKIIFLLIKVCKISYTTNRLYFLVWKNTSEEIYALRYNIFTCFLLIPISTEKTPVILFVFDMYKIRPKYGFNLRFNLKYTFLNPYFYLIM